MAGEDQRKLKEDIQQTEEELAKLADEERQRRERIELAAEEDVQTKSRILGRDILETSSDRLNPDPCGDDDAGGLGEDKKKKTKEADSKEEADYFPGIPHVSAPVYAAPSVASAHAAPPVKVDAVTGVLPTAAKQTMIARSGAGSVREMVIRGWDSYLRRKGEAGSAKFKDVYKRMWLLSKSEAYIQEDRQHNLRVLEDGSTARRARMNELNDLEAGGRLTSTTEGELRRLENQEANRYILRERVLRGKTLAEQEKMTWLQPIGGGALSVIPYTFLTTWDLMSTRERKIGRWYYDNLLLRWQHAIVGRFIPKKAEMRWFKKKVKSDAESMFEDVDEEIYSEEKFAQQVKEGQSQLEDMEEEISGYDRFTIAEEKEIKKMFEEEVKKQAALEKIIESY